VSLCPQYCDCPECPHGTPICEECEKCFKQRQFVKDQIEHAFSVAQQKSKLRPLIRKEK
jgi:hypothetical protein